MSDIQSVLDIRLFQVIVQGYWANSFPLFVESHAKYFPSQRLNQEFHAGFHARSAFAIAVEKPEGCGSQIEQFVSGQKVCVQLCQMRRGPKAPAQINTEAAPQFAIPSFGDSP